MFWGPSLVVQWLRPFAPKAGGLGSISDQRTTSRMPTNSILQVKIQHTATMIEAPEWRD